MDIADLKQVEGMPLLLEVESQGMKLNDWMQANAADIRRIIECNGAVLLRGLKIPSSRQFGQCLTTLFGEELLPYMYRSTPRTGFKGNVFTATEYPDTQTIAQHNENAYANVWPARIGFLCLLPSETGGETPITDSTEVYNRIDSAIREEFERRKVMYVRNYSDLDLPWQEVFQTDEKSAVEQYCNDNGLTFEWTDNDGLRTKQINGASIVHPYTKKPVWFNQAHLFHVSNLEPSVREALTRSLGEAHLPRNTYFGDGSPIDEQMLDQIRRVYDEVTIKFTWQKNDLMLLDNMLYAHGRTPYTGMRKVLTAMALPTSQSDLPVLGA